MKYIMSKKVFEDYNIFGDHPYIKHKSKTSLDFSPKAFIEWYPILDSEGHPHKEKIDTEDSFINSILKPKESRVLLRFGLDTSGEDDTGIIDKILSNKYNTIKEGDDFRGWKFVLVDEIVLVLIMLNQFANQHEDDDIYNAYYIVVEDEFAAKIKKECDIEYANRQVESEKNLAEMSKKRQEKDNYNKTHYPYYTLEHRALTRNKLREIDNNTPFELRRYEDGELYQRIHIRSDDWEDKTDYETYFINTLKNNNIDVKKEDGYVLVSTEQFPTIDISWFK